MPTVSPHPKGGPKASKIVLVYLYAYSCVVSPIQLFGTRAIPWGVSKGPEVTAEPHHSTRHGGKNTTKPQISRAIATKSGTPPPPEYAGSWQGQMVAAARSPRSIPLPIVGGNTTPHEACLQRFHSACPELPELLLFELFYHSMMNWPRGGPTKTQKNNAHPNSKPKGSPNKRPNWEQWNEK